MVKTPFALLLGLGALIGSFIVFACGSEGPPTNSAGATSGAGAGAYGTSECRACVGDACAADITACTSDAGCAAWLACLDACALGPNGDADPACEATCPVDGSVAAQGRDAIVACRRSGAGALCTACGGGGGGGAGGGALCTLPASVDQECGPSDYTDPCIDCQYEECCDSVRDIEISGPTQELADCWLACDVEDHACQGGCYDQYPDGVQGFGTYRACVNVNCRTTGRCTPETARPCAECQHAECTCEMASCFDDVDCLLTFECVGDCDLDVGCAQACPSQHPGAEDLWEALVGCTAQRCIDVCGG